MALRTRTDLVSLVDCTNTNLRTRRLWATQPTREPGTLPLEVRWASIETVGRQWLAAGRPVVWRLFDVSGNEQRVSGGMIRCATLPTLDAFIGAARDHSRGRPQRILPPGRVAVMTIDDDDLPGQWSDAASYAATVGPALYPGWRLEWRYGTGHPREPLTCQHEATIRCAGGVRTLTLTARMP